ncbi:MAG: GNAT family N-acetyltransferase, partial [Betaproteobacteria bacterium]|nr:GNAT family N-acetyltransferase [Betaproteobacteria bacterium]
MSKKSTLSNPKSQLHIRNASLADVPAICDLTARVYVEAGMKGYSSGAITGQINIFPEGQFVVTVDEKVVGYCATFITRGDIALKPHSWVEITGNGYAARHDPGGDWLYGMEVCVDPEYRGYRLGQRLYNQRKKLCEERKLKGIVFIGRLPTLARRMKRFGSAENYVREVQEKRQRDPVLSFQLRNRFEIIGVIPDYITNDQQSLGYGVHLVWRNPKVPQGTATKSEYSGGRLADSVRVGTVQYMLRRVHS